MLGRGGICGGWEEKFSINYGRIVEWEGSKG